MSRVGFCGLGVMGRPMAGHLARVGHEVRVFNRTASVSLDWVGKNPGSAHPTPSETAEGCEMVMLCVGDDADVRDVVLGREGILAGITSGSVIVDHTTTSAEVAREMSRACVEAGVHFVDAPVSGGQAGAENGVLTVMCGSDSREAYERFASIAPAYARSVALLGGAGAGQLAKMVNQICIAGIVQGLSEGLAFAERAGLDAHAVVEVISKGAAQSWQMDNRAHTMIDDSFDFGFAVEWMIKDLGHCIAEARRNEAQVPVAELVLGYYRDVAAAGGGRLDTSSLIRRLR